MMKQQQGSSVWGGPQQQTQSKPNGLYQVGGVNRLTRSNSNNGRPLGLSASAWPPLQHATTQQQQQQNGSGMRAVFLGAPSAKRECAGTGVFLPRRVNTPTEPRKKSGDYIFSPFCSNFKSIYLFSPESLTMVSFLYLQRVRLFCFQPKWCRR